jgi:hypothetical protein
MAEQVRKRTVRLSGLGATLEDTMGELTDVVSIARSSEEKAEIDRLVRDLEKVRDDIQRFCRVWSRSFDVYE